jgi:hypothetical protein
LPTTTATYNPVRMMRWSLALAAVFLPLIDAREQHHFALTSTQGTTINPRRTQPWSLSVSQNPLDSTCIVITAPQQTQSHKWIQEPGDVFVVNKTLGGSAAVEQVDEYLLEIIGYDKRILWQEASRICAAIESRESPDVDAYAEFEVVCPLSLEVA